MFRTTWSSWVKAAMYSSRSSKGSAFEFLAGFGVGDDEFFLVEGWVGAEDEAAGVAALDVDEVLLVVGAEAVEEVGVHGDADLMDDFLVLAHDGVEGALEFHAHGHGALDHAFAAAMRAWDEDGAGEALVGALAGHFHETELGDREHMGAGLVALEAFFDACVNGLLILAILHVDEVGNDQSTDIAEAELTGNFLGGFEVCLKDGFFHVLRPLVAAGVDIHRDHGLGLIDDNVAAAGQPDLAVEGGVDLGLHAEAFEDRLDAGVVLDGFLGTLGNLAHKILHTLGRLRVVDDDGIHLVGEEVAHRALDEIGLLEKAGGGGFFVEAFLDLRPLLEKDAQVAHEVAGTLAGTDRAHDDAHALGHFEFAQDFAEAFALFGILDLAGDAELVVEGHENQITAGHADICCDARALVADGAFFHLHEDIRAHGVDVWHILVGDARGLLLGVAVAAIDGLNAAVEGGRDGVPELEEGIFLKSDVNEHGFDAGLDVADLAFKNAADDVAIGFAFDGVFLEPVVLEKRDAFLKLFTADDQLNAGGFFSDS